MDTTPEMGPPRPDDDQGIRRTIVEARGLPDTLDKTFAPIEEVLYDEGMVHRVLPDEQGKTREASSGYIMDH